MLLIVLLLISFCIDPEAQVRVSLGCIPRSGTAVSKGIHNSRFIDITKFLFIDTPTSLASVCPLLHTWPGAVRLLRAHQSDGRGVALHCYFSCHVLGDWWAGRSFCLCGRRSHIPLWELLIHIFCPFLYWVVWLFLWIIEFFVFGPNSC